MSQELSTHLRTFSTSRRHFLRATAIAGSMAAAATLLPSQAAGRALAIAAAQEGGDLGILNFALTLEHLENRLYRDLIAAGILTGTALEYARVFGDHENTHARDLAATIQQLGGTPVQEQAAYNFPQLSSEAEVINLLAQVEDVGASAYLGAAPLIQNGDLLTVAVQIHTVEAEHATAFRALAGQDPLPFAFAEGRTMDEVVAIVGPFLAAPQMPDTGLTSSDGLKMVGIAGGIAAAAAGATLLRGQKTEATEAE
jgi:hypothetical protein